jgi:hypothetical protein
MSRAAVRVRAWVRNNILGRKSHAQMVLDDCVSPAGGILAAFRMNRGATPSQHSVAICDELFTSSAAVPRKEPTLRNGGANRSNRP